jgi:hypothetical protein
VDCTTGSPACGLARDAGSPTERHSLNWRANHRSKACQQQVAHGRPNVTRPAGSDLCASNQGEVLARLQNFMDGQVGNLASHSLHVVRSERDVRRLAGNERAQVGDELQTA